MMTKKYLFIGAAFAALMFAGCKPTENNYRAAYDAALAKRREAAEQQMRPATGLLDDEGPQMRVLAGDTVFVLSGRLSRLDGSRPEGKWALAVALYKMDTNARAAASDLALNGYPDAFAAKSTDDNYYTVAAVSASMDSVVAESKAFKLRFPGYPYVGLPGAPVLIAF